MDTPKVAIIHEWLINFAGSEKVVEQILLVFPESDLLALIESLAEKNKKAILNKKVKTSFLQYFPFVKKHYRYYLPLMPFAVSRLSSPASDIIISSSHAVSKGIGKTKQQLHICYCHTPMRYAWDLHDSYLKSAGLNKGLKGYIVRRILSYMRKWDLKSASNVDYFIANSNYVAERIKKIYNRSSYVIYPPVNTNYFQLHEQKEDFYLTIARMVSYKKVDLIVETFNQFPDKKLVVIGSGPDLSKIQKLANKNIEVLGYQTEEVLRNYLQNAKAFVFAADEDFGITSIEAQACGTPVLAYRKGGNLETVVENKTGLFFDEQTVQSLKDCILQFEKQTSHFSPLTIREHAEKFSEERFRRNIKEFISEKYSQFLLEQQTIGRKKEKTS